LANNTNVDAYAFWGNRSGGKAGVNNASKEIKRWQIEIMETVAEKSCKETNAKRVSD
jgi:hypothetical protein